MERLILISKAMIPLNWEDYVSGTTTKQLSRIREGEIHSKESKDKVTKEQWTAS